jgi:uncharacterized protein (DUF433 family)
MIDDPKGAGYGPEAIEILRGLDPPIQRSSVEIGDEIDWSQCPDVESVPDRCSGAWCVKGTRVMVQGIIDNAEDFTAEQIARDIYDLDVDVVRRILTFAAR